MTNRGEHFLSQLRQKQRALRLDDRDIEELPDVPPSPVQPPSKQEDLDFYEQMFQEMAQRQTPIHNNDRRELDYFRQVFHLSDDEVFAIEQRVIQDLGRSQDDERAIVPDSASKFPNRDAEISGVTISPEDSYGGSGSTTPTLSNKPLNPNQDAILKALERKGEQQGSPHQPATTEPSLAASSSSPNADLPERGTPANPASPPDTAASPSTGSVTIIQTAPSTGERQIEPTTGAEASATTTATGTGKDEGNTQEKEKEEKKAVSQKNTWIDRRVLLPFLAMGLVLGTFAIVAWWMLNSNSVSRTIDPQRSQQFLQAGTEKSQQGEFQAAIKDFDQAIQLNPNDADAYINRGYAHHRAGNLDAAVSDYNEAIDLVPNSAQAFSNRSHVRFDQGRITDAVQDATKAIELKKDLPEAYINLGNGLFAQGNIDRAAQEFQTALTLPASNPTKARAHNNRGNIFFNANQTQEAGQQYDQAIQLDPNYADAFYNRALAHERNQNWQAAAQDFNEAARLYRSQGNDRRNREAQSKAEQAQQRAITTPPPPTATPDPNQRSI